jgi:hypothetical protein
MSFNSPREKVHEMTLLEIVDSLDNIKAPADALRLALRASVMEDEEKNAMHFLIYKVTDGLDELSARVDAARGKAA